jgi:hypothetical protein
MPIEIIYSNDVDRGTVTLGADKKPTFTSSKSA